MSNTNYILITKLCSVYEVEHSFFEELEEFGLIEMKQIEHQYCVEEDRISEIEKILRIRTELKLNTEGIDVVLNLFQKLDHLPEDLRVMKQQLEVLR